MEKEAFNEDSHDLNFKYMGGLMEKKCKIFSGEQRRDSEGLQKLENEINEWLSDNADIKIINVSASSLNDYNDLLTIIVFYSQ